MASMRTATTTNQSAGNPFLRHEGYMRLMAARLRWLERRHHWWLRTPEGQSQLEFLQSRDAA